MDPKLFMNNPEHRNSGNFRNRLMGGRRQRGRANMNFRNPSIRGFSLVDKVCSGNDLNIDEFESMESENIDNYDFPPPASKLDLVNQFNSKLNFVGPSSSFKSPIENSYFYDKFPPNNMARSWGKMLPMINVPPLNLGPTRFSNVRGAVGHTAGPSLSIPAMSSMNLPSVPSLNISATPSFNLPIVPSLNLAAPPVYNYFPQQEMLGPKTHSYVPTICPPPSTQKTQDVERRIPDGSGFEKYPSPNIDALPEKDSLGLRFDSSTGLFYDDSVGLFYNCQLKKYLYWDVFQHTYLTYTLPIHTEQNRNSALGMSSPAVFSSANVSNVLPGSPHYMINTKESFEKVKWLAQERVANSIEVGKKQDDACRRGSSPVRKDIRRSRSRSRESRNRVENRRQGRRYSPLVRRPAARKLSPEPREIIHKAYSSHSATKYGYYGREKGTRREATPDNELFDQRSSSELLSRRENVSQQKMPIEEQYKNQTVGLQKDPIYMPSRTDESPQKSSEMRKNSPARRSQSNRSPTNSPVRPQAKQLPRGMSPGGNNFPIKTSINRSPSRLSPPRRISRRSPMKKVCDERSPQRVSTDQRSNVRRSPEHGLSGWRSPKPRSPVRKPFERKSHERRPSDRQSPVRRSPGPRSPMRKSLERKSRERRPPGRRSPLRRSPVRRSPAKRGQSPSKLSLRKRLGPSPKRNRSSEVDIEVNSRLIREAREHPKDMHDDSQFMLLGEKKERKMSQSSTYDPIEIWERSVSPEGGYSRSHDFANIIEKETVHISAQEETPRKSEYTVTMSHVDYSEDRYSEQKYSGRRSPRNLSSRSPSRDPYFSDFSRKCEESDGNVREWHPKENVSKEIIHVDPIARNKEDEYQITGRLTPKQIYDNEIISSSLESQIRRSPFSEGGRFRSISPKMRPRRMSPSIRYQIGSEEDGERSHPPITNKDYHKCVEDFEKRDILSTDRCNDQDHIKENHRAKVISSHQGVEEESDEMVDPFIRQQSIVGYEDICYSRDGSSEGVDKNAFQRRSPVKRLVVIRSPPSQTHESRSFSRSQDRVLLSPALETRRSPIGRLNLESAAESEKYSRYQSIRSPPRDQPRRSPPRDQSRRSPPRDQSRRSPPRDQHGRSPMLSTMRGQEKSPSLRVSDENSPYIAHQKSPFRVDERRSLAREEERRSPEISYDRGSERSFQSKEQRSPIRTQNEKLPTRSRDRRSPIMSRERRPPIKARDDMSPHRTQDQRSPIRSQNQKSPDRSRDQRSPIRSRNERQPIRSRDQRSPFRSRDQRTPIRSRDQRSPFRSRDQRSPIRSQDERPPIRSRDQRSPIRSRDQKLPVRSRERRSPIKSQDRRSPVRSRDQRSPIKLKGHRSPIRKQDRRSPIRPGDHRSPIRNRYERSPIRPQDSWRSRHRRSPNKSLDKRSPLRSRRSRSPIRSRRSRSPIRSRRSRSLSRSIRSRSPSRSVRSRSSRSRRNRSPSRSRRSRSLSRSRRSRSPSRSRRTRTPLQSQEHFAEKGSHLNEQPQEIKNISIDSSNIPDSTQLDDVSLNCSRRDKFNLGSQELSRHTEKGVPSSFELHNPVEIKGNEVFNTEQKSSELDSLNVNDKTGISDNKVRDISKEQILEEGSQQVLERPELRESSCEPLHLHSNNAETTPSEVTGIVMNRSMEINLQCESKLIDSFLKINDDTKMFPCLTKETERIEKYSESSSKEVLISLAKEKEQSFLDSEIDGDSIRDDQVLLESSKNYGLERKSSGYLNDDTCDDRWSIGSNELNYSGSSSPSEHFDQESWTIVDHCSESGDDKEVEMSLSVEMEDVEETTNEVNIEDGVTLKPVTSEINHSKLVEVDEIVGGGKIEVVDHYAEKSPEMRIYDRNTLPETISNVSAPRLSPASNSKNTDQSYSVDSAPVQAISKKLSVPDQGKNPIHRPQRRYRTPPSRSRSPQRSQGRVRRESPFTASKESLGRNADRRTAPQPTIRKPLPTRKDDTDDDPLSHYFERNPTNFIFVKSQWRGDPLLIKEYLSDSLQKSGTRFIKVILSFENESGGPYDHWHIIFHNPQDAVHWYQTHNGKIKLSEKFRNKWLFLYYSLGNWKCPQCNSINFTLRSLCFNCYSHKTGGLSPIKLVSNPTRTVGVYKLSLGTTERSILKTVGLKLKSFSIKSIKIFEDRSMRHSSGLCLFEMDSAIQATELYEYLSNHVHKIRTYDRYAQVSYVTMEKANLTARAPRSTKPDGLGDVKYPIPDSSTFLFEPVSNMYYDPNTKLYYNSSASLFYNDDLSIYLYYDKAQMTYERVES